MSALTRRRVAEELLTAVRIGSLQTTTSARAGWRDDIFRGFRPTKISRSVALTRMGWFARHPEYLQQLLDIYLNDLSIPGAFGERMTAASDDARIPAALREILADLASHDLSAIPAGLDDVEPTHDSAASEATEQMSSSSPDSAATPTEPPTDPRPHQQHSFTKEPFEWTPPGDDASRVQDAVTLFERSLSAFIEHRLPVIHGDAWRRRGCGPYLKRWAEKADRATGSQPGSELGYADLAELNEIICLKANWPVFEPYFGNKHFIDQQFGHILQLRNDGFHPGQRVLYASEEAAAFAAMARVTVTTNPLLMTLTSCID